MPEFDSAFKTLTGSDPFPWQRAMYAHMAAGEWDKIATCSLPTGLGKTSILAVWLIALANHPGEVPRRLVYVVNRRTVVDQTTGVAEALRWPFAEPDRPWHPVLHDLRMELCRGCGLAANANPLAISTLRGQYADNREWSADPSRPAIVCGTVDMIGSRLLFSGYRAGRYDRTHEAGLLGCDALLVHDEAHLTDPFQKLLRRIQAEQRAEAADGRGLRVVELTATPRTEGGPPPFGLLPEDEAHPVVRQRLDAVKTLHLHPQPDRDAVTAEIVRRLATHKESRQAILAFIQSPSQVLEIEAALTGRQHGVDKGAVRVLTGTMRGWERDRLADCDPVFARFLPSPRVEPQAGETVYLICTSAGEVGVDLSADHLVCDLTTFEGMAQRLGRVNRRGGPDPATGEPRQARVDVVHESHYEADTPRGERLGRSLLLFQKLEAEYAGSTSPETLRTALTDAEKQAAFAPPVPTVEATDILFDAWALTTVTDDLPGRPADVAPWLHGLEPPDQPTTAVAWRLEVATLAPDTKADEAAVADRTRAVAAFLDEYPLLPHELLAERTARLVSAGREVDRDLGEAAARHRHLEKLARRAGDQPAWLLDARGRPALTTVGDLAQADFRALVGRTIVLPPAAGGLTRGMLDGNSATADDVADLTPGGSRVRFREVVPANGDPKPLGDQPAADFRDQCVRVAVVRLKSVGDEVTDKFVAFVDREWLAGEDSRSRASPFQQDLEDHLERARRHAARMAGRLLPDGPERRAVEFAAARHDLGKDRPPWQRAVGNPPGGDGWRPWAKSGRRGRLLGLEGYRHEFGSLLDVQRLPAFGELPAEERELVLHLIAAHHARGRPHFPVGEDFDWKHPGAEAEMAAAVPQRFARLQRKYGRWGLAYLESLVRAADVLASQKAEGGGA